MNEERGAPGQRRRRLLWTALAALTSLLLILLALVLLAVLQDHPGPEEVTGPWPYVLIFGLVFGDAVIPILPAETTLNTASTLAAQGYLDLGWVMVAGAIGAVLGDSALYWVAHLSRRHVQGQLDAAMANTKVATAMEVIGSSAGALLVFGRYVPGLRFVVNASLGLARHPYRDFVRWSALGGIAWSIYICAVAYVVGTALLDAPFAAIVVSAIASSLAVAVVFFIVARRVRKIRRRPSDAP